MRSKGEIMKFYVATIACLMFGLASAYGADSSTGPAAGTRHGACSGDIKRHCADIQRGKGKIPECLVAHAADLSPECRKRMEKYAKTPT